MFCYRQVSRSFSSFLRVRPVFLAAIGFSWPSRSPYAGWLIFGVFFIPGLPLLRCSFRIFSISSHMCCHAPFFSASFDSTCAFLRHCLAGISSVFSRLSFVARGFRAAARISLFVEMWSCRLGAGPLVPALHHTSPEGVIALLQSEFFCLAL